MRNPSADVAVEILPVGYGAIAAKNVEALRWRLTHPTEKSRHTVFGVPAR
jgi:hypothetical protein